MKTTQNDDPYVRLTHVGSYGLAFNVERVTFVRLAF